MSRKIRNLEGQRFGKLTVIDKDLEITRHARWNCICDCGNKTTVYEFNLLEGKSQSCRRCIRKYDDKVKKQKIIVYENEKDEFIKENLTEIKHCTACGKEFIPIFKNATERKYCYDCVPAGIDSSHFKLKSTISRLKAEFGNKCFLCGYDKCSAALEFHHKDGDEKEKNISSIARAGYEKAFKEAQKCVLLCANCHREAHDLSYSFNKNNNLEASL